LTKELKNDEVLRVKKKAASHGTKIHLHFGCRRRRWWRFMNLEPLSQSFIFFVAYE
jgi:hypothetical protein